MKNYGWQDEKPTCAHAYLLPQLLRVIANVGERRPLRILDLGCGNGFVAAELGCCGHDVIGIDSSPDGIAIAKATYQGPRFAVASIDAADLDQLGAHGVDCVVALEVIEHLYYPRELFRKSYEALRPEGWLIISTPYHGYLKNLALSVADRWDEHFHVGRDGGHIKFFSRRTLTEMATEHGFANLQFRFAGRLPWLWKSMILLARK